MADEGVPLLVIQRQLGYSNLGITSIYLQGIDNAEIMDPSTPAERRWFPRPDRSDFDNGRRERRASRIAAVPLARERWHEPGSVRACV
jgi:hypothetical protein